MAGGVIRILNLPSNFSDKDELNAQLSTFAVPTKLYIRTDSDFGITYAYVVFSTYQQAEYVSSHFNRRQFNGKQLIVDIISPNNTHASVCRQYPHLIQKPQILSSLQEGISSLSLYPQTAVKSRQNSANNVQKNRTSNNNNAYQNNGSLRRNTNKTENTRNSIHPNRRHDTVSSVNRRLSNSNGQTNFLLNSPRAVYSTQTQTSNNNRTLYQKNYTIPSPIQQTFKATPSSSLNSPRAYPVLTSETSNINNRTLHQYQSPIKSISSQQTFKAAPSSSLNSPRVYPVLTSGASNINNRTLHQYQSPIKSISSQQTFKATPSSSLNSPRAYPAPTSGISNNNRTLYDTTPSPIKSISTRQSFNATPSPIKTVSATSSSQTLYYNRVSNNDQRSNVQNSTTTAANANRIGNVTRTGLSSDSRSKINGGKQGCSMQ